ncbi:MAG: L-serine ammonia-lyase, iron-sulfur-dependent subunit beta [Lachnospiraceae bacterium]|nr:L-serine ammonia-lyase, iron-sulfur-dependent subunit beta [Lachnospiraceae bacterium]
MNLFDIIGPVMVGPSSSHTAGAVKIGYVARKLMSQPVCRAEILLYGSFLATGKGHGTPYAIVAGLLGMKPDDSRIPDSFRIAEESGMELVFGEAALADGHPNSVQLKLTGRSGRQLEIVGQSLGGSVINIASIDGLDANFSGDYPTLIVHNLDQPGHVAEVTSMLAHKSVNIAAMQLYRAGRGGNAVMVIECDQEIPVDSIKWLEHLEGVEKVTYYSLKEDEEMEDR